MLNIIKVELYFVQLFACQVTDGKINEFNNEAAVSEYGISKMGENNKPTRQLCDNTVFHLCMAKE